MLKKLFGKKKDEDDDDEDFEDEDLDDDIPEESDIEDPDEDEPDDDDDPTDPGADDEDKDDDDEYDDEDDDDEYGDEYEEEGRFGALWGNKWIRFSIIGVCTLFLLIGVGVGGWIFISGGAEEDAASQAGEGGLSAISSGGGLQPSSSLNSVSSSGTEEGSSSAQGQLLPPPVSSKETAVGEQLTDAGAVSGLGVAAGLNAIGTGGGTGGLNAVDGEGVAEAGGGVVVPVSTASSYRQFPNYPTNDELPKAPIGDLLQLRGEELPLPKPATDGRVSWQEYARPSKVSEDKRRVALLITGLGLSRAATLSAISKLPSAVSLSFSPYAEELEQWMIRSRREGHEVVLVLPLESKRFPIEDAGPLALLTSLSDEENMKLLETVLSSQQGYIGVEVSMGSKFTSDEFRVRELLTELNRRGLMIIDGVWNDRSLIPRVAKEMAMPRVISNVRLDNVMAKSAVNAKLKELDTVVELRGSGVGTTTITPAILEQVLAWISSLPGKGIELVPVSALISTEGLPPVQ